MPPQRERNAIETIGIEPKAEKQRKQHGVRIRVGGRVVEVEKQGQKHHGQPALIISPAAVREEKEREKHDAQAASPEVTQPPGQRQH